MTRIIRLMDLVLKKLPEGPFKDEIGRQFVREQDREVRGQSLTQNEVFDLESRLIAAALQSEVGVKFKTGVDEDKMSLSTSRDRPKKAKKNASKG